MILLGDDARWKVLALIESDLLSDPAHDLPPVYDHAPSLLGSVEVGWAAIGEVVNVDVGVDLGGGSPGAITDAFVDGVEDYSVFGTELYGFGEVGPLGHITPHGEQDQLGSH